MKKILILLILLFLISYILSADVMEVRRFGLFIGANNGGDARQRLLYADDDARAMATTMGDIGGINPADSILLLDPTSEKVRSNLKMLTTQIEKVDNLVRRTEIMFYYSGHSDENGILLKDDQIRYREIREELSSAGADVVIAVLDSCSSGAFTRTKGGQRRSPFLIDESSEMEGHAFLTSSSETELSQESDRIGASFFTHYLITGLRGAADNTGDGRVTLNEVYQHTYQETLSRTESTIGGPQHPNYEIQLTGTGDLVLTDLTVPTSALQLSGELAGRFSIRDNRDHLIAEFTKPGGDTLKLVLPSGAYTIRLNEKISFNDSDNVKTAEVDLNQNAQLYLRERDFTSSDGLEYTRFRGTLSQQDKDEKFVFSIVPGLDFPTINDGDLVRIQAGLLGSYASQISGIQASWFFNITDNDSEGIQASEIFNIANQGFRGLQVSGIFNITQDSFVGIQNAGIFNTAGRPSSGIQAAGIFNTAGELKGVQAAGVFNYSQYMHGIQASVLNTAGTMRGIQLGVLNISREIYGLPIGLINLSRNGIVDTGIWYEYDDDYRLYSSFQSGTRYFYTLYYFGNTIRDYFSDPQDMVWGFHIGSRLAFGPLDIDLDTGVKQSYMDLKNNRDDFPIPSARAIISLKGTGLFWGVTMDISLPESEDSSLFTGRSFSIMGNEDYKAYYRYVFGLRI